MQPDSREAEATLPLDGLVVDNIGKSFRKRPVVKGVSLRLARGEVVGLLGPNGAGKTTCFYMITGLVPVDEGTIEINGNDVTEEIREPRISAAVSRVATILEVRRILIDRMRRIIDAHDRAIVVEGRDITTVVAPDADVRVLLVADPAARVARRAAEVAGKASAAEVTSLVRATRLSPTRSTVR